MDTYLTEQPHRTLYLKSDESFGGFIIEREDGSLQDGLTPQQRERMERARDEYISELEQQIEQSSQDKNVN